MDFDGDTFLCTDNKILLAKTKNDKTIMCIQRKAEKVIPTEEDIIASNKIAFNDEIGVITNRVTSMFDVLAGIPKDTEEYKTLEYRILCGQLFQQNAVDACKGIIASKMPKSWYDRHVCKDPIVADRKPYFMIYVYPNLKKDYDDLVKKSNTKAKIMFGKSVDKIINDGAQNEDEAEFLQYFYNLMPVGYHDCVVNRVAWIVEDAFKNYVEYVKQDLDFDYTILKSGVGYTQTKYKAIEKLYNEFTFAMRQAQGKQKTIRIDDTEQRSILLENFKRDCILTVPNAKELCDIVLDLCYTKETSKMFAWQICGDVIIDNLMEKANNISFPVRDDDNAEFSYMGYGFRMEQF